MSSSYLDRAEVLTKGRLSSYFGSIQDCDIERKLDEEQVSIMALVLENLQLPFTSSQVMKFTTDILTAQALMPTGRIHSKQIIVTIALMGGLR